MATIPSTASRTLFAAGTPTYRFVSVNGESPLFEKVRNVFLTSIAPLYGNQDKALGQIYESSDRTCELLLDESDDPKGILVYKNDVQDEFADEGIENSLEIKTLMVVNPTENSGKGFGRRLMGRIIHIAEEKMSAGIHVTVSEEAEGPKEYFEHYGFNAVKTWEGRYAEGVREYLLFKSLKS